MKTLMAMLIISAVALPFAACTDVSHTESTKSNWDGSTTHQETTVKTAPDGSTTVDKSTQRVR